MSTTRTSKSKFALVVIDMATRWLEIIPLRAITSESICNALLSIFTTFGFPSIVLSDNGPQFISTITSAFHKMLQMTQIFATRYHPQSNGCCERANQTIKLMIEKVCLDKAKDWDIYLPMLLFAYRNSVHASTGFSPFQLMFGRNAKSPIQNFKDNLLQNKEIEMEPEEFLQSIQDQIEYANNVTKENLAQSNEYSSNLNNKHRFLRTLEINDLVLVFLPTGTGNNKQWYGILLLKNLIRFHTQYS